MKKIDLSQFIQIIANVGVIAGIIFLGVEINQNSEMMTAQTRNAIAQSVIENIKMGMDPRLVDAYLKSVRHDALSEEEVFLLDQLANATFRTQSVERPACYFSVGSSLALASLFQGTHRQIGGPF